MIVDSCHHSITPVPGFLICYHASCEKSRRPERLAPGAQINLATTVLFSQFLAATHLKKFFQSHGNPRLLQMSLQVVVIWYRELRY
jgi:hypothetical protein